MTEATQNRRGGGKDPMLLRQLYDVVAPQDRAKNRSALVGSVGIGVLEGVALAAIIPTINAYFTGRPVWGLGVVGWLIVIAVIAVIAGIWFYVSQMKSYRVAMGVLSDVATRMGDKMATLPLGWFGPTRTGMISRLVSSGLMSIGEALSHFVLPIVRGMGTVAFLLVCAWIWRWQLGLLLTLMVPVLYLASLAGRKLERKGRAKNEQSKNEAAGRVIEYCSAQPALRAAGRAHDYQPLQQAQAANERDSRQALWLSAAGNLLGGLAGQLIIIVAVLGAAYLGGLAVLSPLETVAFIGIALRMMTVLANLVAFLMAAESARPSLRQLDSILQEKALPEAPAEAQLSAPGTVEFDDVTFGYAQRPVIRSFSAQIPPRTLTAIVGPSGCGKTTLFRLIARFWDVDSGAVRVGGVPVTEQTTAQLMSQLSLVFQDVYLYDDTLEANIRVGRPDASADEVRRVADVAGVSEIAQRLPGGWQSRVGEGGKRLSGGERQRVSIARALLKDAPIVLFDEATSALDPENEHRVSRAIELLRQRATVLVIAHKLDTVRNADQILVLDGNGTLSQVGTHDQLVRVPGVYATFWRARKAAAGWTLAPEGGQAG